MTFHDPNPTAAEKRARRWEAKAEAFERRADEHWERVREGRTSQEAEAKRFAISAVKMRNQAREERMFDLEVSEEDHELNAAMGAYGEELPEPGEEDWQHERTAPTMQARIRDHVSYSGRMR